MTVAAVFLILGAILGWRRAAKRGGNAADQLQYAAVHGIVGFLIGMAAMTIMGHTGLLNF
ncbi:MAG: hypothetical protein AAF439_09440 [Pseudomonadota bacterium]